MTDAGYEDNLSKQNLFSTLAKKTQLILFLDNYGSTYDTNDDLNEKMYFCLKNQLEITTVVERNESRIVIQRVFCSSIYWRIKNPVKLLI